MSLKTKLMALVIIPATVICLFHYTTSFAASISYSYDELNRLKTARYDNGTEIVYSYDEIGNRIQEQTTSSAATSYILTVNAYGCGTVTPSSGDILINSGSSQTFSFQATPGNYLENVVVDGASLGSVSTHPFSNVSANHTLSVKFSSNVPDGDVSLDGFVTQADAQLALQIAVGLVTPTPLMLAHGDVAPFINGMPSPNGRIDTGDAIVILSKVAGTISWPSECVAAQPSQPITNLPVRIANNPAAYFRSLQSAYNTATNGATVQATNSSFAENPNFNRNVSILLDGGYVQDYTTKPDNTTINGSLTISSGTVTVSNIIVK